MVEENDFFARVSLVVFVDGIDQRTGDRRTIALGDVAHALVHGGFKLVQTFSRAEFVIKSDDFKFDTGHVIFVVFLGEVLQGFELVGAYRCHQTRQGVNPSNFDGFTFLR